MSTAARLEEREALTQHRHMARMRRAADTAAQRAYRDRLAEAVRSTKDTWRRCRCEFRGIRSADELRALEGGCTMPSYCCPRLDAVRRRMNA